MRRYGLIGYPLGHSFSRKYFTEKFFENRLLDCIYENYQIDKIEKLPELISSKNDLIGLNVTIPYKSDVLSYLDYIDPEAAIIGSVNVIKVSREGPDYKLKGYNSDINGIEDSIKPYIGIVEKNAIVFGTGGSSRSVRYVLEKLGFQTKIVSRKKAGNSILYSEVGVDLIKNTGILINTTPLGMYPNTDGKPDIDYSLLDKKHLLFDLVYNPEITSFLREGVKHGCTVITGLKMLHTQAERSWDIWNDDNL